MKKNFIAIISLVFIPGMVLAQRTNQDNQNDIPTTENPQQIRKGRLMTFADLDQRKIYHWGNGQRSTPTGRQAGEKWAKFVRVFGDSAVVVRKPINRNETTKR